MASRIHILTVMKTTTGTTKVMVTSAMPVEVMDALFVEDTVTSIREENSDTTDTTSRWDSVLVTPMPTLERRQDHHTTNTSTELVVVTPRDGLTAMEEDMVLDMERDTDSLTDGLCTMDMVMETQAQRDPFWVTVLVLMLLFHNSMIPPTLMAINQYSRKKSTMITTMMITTRMSMRMIMLTMKNIQEVLLMVAKKTKRRSLSTQ